MSLFKVGDKVVIKQGKDESINKEYLGAIGIIQYLCTWGSFAYTIYTNNHGALHFYSDEVELYNDEFELEWI